MFKKYPFYHQYDAMDCGPTCLMMIAKYYGKELSLQYLRNIADFNRSGVNLLGISEAAKAIGLTAIGTKITYDKLLAGGQDVLPCVLHWNQNHFVVLYEINKKRALIADPAKGIIRILKAEVFESWIVDKSKETGVALLLQPTEHFFNLSASKNDKTSLVELVKYLARYRSLLIKLIIGVSLAAFLQATFPILTQTIVDAGIPNKDFSLIYLVLASYFALLFGKLLVDLTRGWILLNISIRVDMKILSDFLYKLLRLPVSYFDTKLPGDVIQRMNDHVRIDAFLTGVALNFFYSIFSFFVFGFILISYNITIFSIFLIGGGAYFLWILGFQKKRKMLDYQRFEAASKNQNIVNEIINGIHEVKLNQCEWRKREEWEKQQVELYNINRKALSIRNVQQLGAFFINEGKNVLITFVSAGLVIKGGISIGEMIAIQFIIGQLNSPLEQLVQFIQTSTDAKMSLARLKEIESLDDEGFNEKSFDSALVKNKDIVINALSFSYPGAGNKYVLNNIDMVIPHGKTTAIVGMSGSGKTTLLKLILKFYPLHNGEIFIGNNNLKELLTSVWRSHCGVVMQNGFIFSGSIKSNICLGEKGEIDHEKLQAAIEIANLKEFIESLPLKLETSVWSDGAGLSEGQKQRLLIARSVYKNPDFIIFDEATNALDANNEKVIVNNLRAFFSGKTVVVVAHRLSTVRHADQIIVLDAGNIVESGTHEALIEKRGKYYELIKNQLELGK